MIDSNYLGLEMSQVLLILALALLALWLLYLLLRRFFWSGGTETARYVDEPLPGHDKPKFQPMPIPAGNERLASELQSEIRTVRGQLDDAIRERMNVEAKLKDAVAEAARIKASTGGSQGDLQAAKTQVDDLVKRLNAQQQDAMATHARLTDEITGLKRQIAQGPAPDILANLNRDVEAAKATSKSLSSELESAKIAYNDVMQRMNNGQKDHMNAVAQLNEQLAAAKRDLQGYQSNSTSAATQAKQYMDGLNRLVYDFVAPPIPHLEGRETAEEQFGKLRNLLQSQKSGGADFQARVTQLQNELSTATKRSADLDSEIARLKMQIAQIPADLSGDVRRLNDQLSQLRRERDAAVGNERGLADKLHVAEHDLAQARGGMEELGRLSAMRQDEITRLKTQLAAMPNVEDYKRFKDALDAANRIASGQKL